jgi:hypothetical protein
LTNINVGIILLLFSYSSSSSHLAGNFGTTTTAAASSSLLASGARVELTAVTPRHERELAGFLSGPAGFNAAAADNSSAAAADRQLLPPSHLDRNLASMLAARGAANKMADNHRSSTGRLATHRFILFYFLTLYGLRRGL